MKHIFYTKQTCAQLTIQIDEIWKQRLPDVSRYTCKYIVYLTNNYSSVCSLLWFIYCLIYFLHFLLEGCLSFLRFLILQPYFFAIGPSKKYYLKLSLSIQHLIVQSQQYKNYKKFLKLTTKDQNDVISHLFLVFLFLTWNK